MDELQMLRNLPAVANVSKDRITYSNAFKQVCVIRYLAGESPTKIFREAGLPPELIGYKRIERSVARWKAAVLKSVNGSSNMSNGEIITELVNLYVHAVTRKEKLDDIAGIVNPDKANIGNAHSFPFGGGKGRGRGWRGNAEYPRSFQTADTPDVTNVVKSEHFQPINTGSCYKRRQTKPKTPDFWRNNGWIDDVCNNHPGRRTKSCSD